MGYGPPDRNIITLQSTHAIVAGRSMSAMRGIGAPHRTPIPSGPPDGGVSKDRHLARGGEVV